MPSIRHSLAAFSLVAASYLPSQARAQDITTQTLAAGSRVDIDGLTDEWSTLPSQPLKLINKNSHIGDSDFSANFQSVYDKDYLYFAITVRDEKFIRTTLAGNGEDKLVLWFGADAKGSKSTALSIYPADLNGSATQDLKFAGKKVAAPKPGKKEIEALESFRTKDGKWMIEIKVPWERLSPDLKPLENIPFCIAVFDGDDKAKLKNEAIAANCELSSKSEPSSLGNLIVEEQQKIMESFLASTKLSREDITKEFYLDVAGDAQLDRVVFAGSVYGILGLGLVDGQYYYYRLTLRSPDDLKSAELLDVDGDGKPNIVLRSVEYDTKGIYSQELLRVLGIKGGLLSTIFGQEVSNTQPEGSITSKYEWKKRGKAFDLIVTQAETKGVEEKKYVDIDAKDPKDYEEILLPWQTDKKKVYKFSKNSYQLSK